MVESFIAPRYGKLNCRRPKDPIFLTPAHYLQVGHPLQSGHMTIASLLQYSWVPTVLETLLAADPSHTREQSRSHMERNHLSDSTLSRTRLMKQNSRSQILHPTGSALNVCSRLRSGQ